MKKKILVLTSSYQRYKDDLSYRDYFVPILTRSLSENFDIAVAAPSDKKLLKEETIDNIKIYRFRQGLFRNSGLAYGSGILPNIRKNKSLLLMIPFFMLNQLLMTKKICKKMKIGVIHSHWVMPQGFIAALYKKLFNRKIKIVTTCPGADILEDEYSFSSNFKKRIIEFSLNNSDAVVTISNENVKAIRKFGYNGKIYLYPYGIDTNFFHPNKRDEAIKERYNINGKIVLFVGNIIERKGVKYIIEAAPEVVNKFPDVSFVFLGIGNEVENMKERAKELGVEKNIAFLGFVSEEEKAKFLATADVFSFPSLSEGFGLVNIEAMSSGIIPIVSDIPVFKEIIGDNGIIVKKENSEEIASAIIEYFKNPDSYIEMKKKAREEVVKKYDWKVAIENYTLLMNSL